MAETTTVQSTDIINGLQTIELEDRKSEIQKAIEDMKNLRLDAEKELKALLQNNN